jgi:hypothetical protein
LEFCEICQRLGIYRDRAGGVWNSSTSKYEVFFVFCSFLCMSLDVLVSFIEIS